RRRHHGGGPAHHMIAGEKRFLLRQRVAHVVGGMAWREDAIEPIALACDDIAISHRHIRHEVTVTALFDDSNRRSAAPARVSAGGGGGRSSACDAKAGGGIKNMWSIAVSSGTGRPFQWRRCRRMIAVRMS